MKISPLILFLLFISTQILSQIAVKQDTFYTKDNISNDSTTSKKFLSDRIYFKFGAGISSFRTKALDIVNFENEIEYKFSNYFSGSLILNYGRGSQSTFSFINGGVNINCSPLGKYKKNNIRFGFGLSYNSLSEYNLTHRYDIFGNLHEDVYIIKRYDLIGANIGLEYSLTLFKRYSIGTKLFMVRLYNEDNIKGVLVNFGMKLF